MRISKKRRKRKLLAGLWMRPRAKLKSAMSMKRPTRRPRGEAVNARSWPMTSLKSQTKKSAPRARSRKVGLKPIEKGRLAKGRRKTTAQSATKPQWVSARIITAAMSAAATTSAGSGPITPMKRAINPAPATSSAPSTSQRASGSHAKTTAWTVRYVDWIMAGIIPDPRKNSQKKRTGRREGTKEKVLSLRAFAPSCALILLPLQRL